VTYPQVTRPGLSATWGFEIRRAGGFEDPITVGTTDSYLGLFDQNAMDPEPAKATSTAGLVMWEFEPPPGEVLVVSLDARVEPGIQWGRSGKTVVYENGEPAVDVAYRTWVMP
jgi:hypothetical protein